MNLSISFYINLGENKIGNSGANAIGKMLLANTTIRVLDLSMFYLLTGYNAITDLGAGGWAKPLENNSTLNKVNRGKYE